MIKVNILTNVAEGVEHLELPCLLPGEQTGLSTLENIMQLQEQKQGVIPVCKAGHTLP